MKQTTVPLWEMTQEALDELAHMTAPQIVARYGGSIDRARRWRQDARARLGLERPAPAPVRKPGTVKGYRKLR